MRWLTLALALAAALAAPDYYQTLGVPRDASARDIKKAYRRQAVALHPDSREPSAEGDEAFVRLAFAYEVLSDSVWRARYDYGLKRGQTEYDEHADWSGVDSMLENKGPSRGGRPAEALARARRLHEEAMREREEEAEQRDQRLLYGLGLVLVLSVAAPAALWQRRRAQRRAERERKRADFVDRLSSEASKERAEIEAEARERAERDAEERERSVASRRAVQQARRGQQRRGEGDPALRALLMAPVSVGDVLANADATRRLCVFAQALPEGHEFVSMVRFLAEADERLALCAVAAEAEADDDAYEDDVEDIQQQVLAATAALVQTYLARDAPAALSGLDNDARSRAMSLEHRARADCFADIAAHCEEALERDVLAGWVHTPEFYADVRPALVSLEQFVGAAESLAARFDAFVDADGSDDARLALAAAAAVEARDLQAAGELVGAPGDADALDLVQLAQADALRRLFDAYKRSPEFEALKEASLKVRVADDGGRDDNRDEDAVPAAGGGQLRCTVCRKSFKSAASMANHEKSKAHQKAVKAAARRK